MPKPMVVDIYHGNVVTSFEAVKDAGIVGVIHKASQGSSFKDKKYAVRKPQAIEEGLLWGAYHFGDNSNVQDQVNNFLSVVGDDKNVLLCLDFEPNPKGGSMTLEQAVEFLETVFKITGQRAVIYSGHWIKEALQKTTIYDKTLSQYRLWLCQYGPKTVIPTAWDKYWLWQYTGDGIGPKPHSVAGIQGDSDLNHFDGTVDEFKASWLGGATADFEALPFANSDPVAVTVSSETSEPVLEMDEPKPMCWMVTAKGLMGTKEVAGSKSNPLIMDWAKAVGLKSYTTDSIPWCGLFVAYVLGHNGLDISNAPLWALSWRNWGMTLSEPSFGCVMVFKRNGGGHVGFYVSEDSQYYHILGGNQSDTVNVMKIAKSRCVGYRWPTEFKDSEKSGRIVKKFDGKVSVNES